jgi:tyrosinase
MSNTSSSGSRVLSASRV